ncbi:hypothetical protein O3M35_008215 [Rhynocoris fuscipes]|uniref:BTB domain-containing protein n=1 Tax=Rhynocoris fuscipes TaxID=488301 RepID=A0AAW1D919_9HEMI
MTNVYNGVDFRLWPLFDFVDEYTLKQIILLHIFGSLGQSAIFVTKDDQVYAVGDNVGGSLGIGDIQSTKTPIRLDLLCGKCIVGFASGSTHTIAYSREGELYSWGDNSLGKLGNGTIISRDSPGRVMLPDDVKIVRVACSDRYTAAITSELKILHWGDIEWNCGAPQTLPIYLEFPDDVQIFDLCCGALHAAALTMDGQVYTWGCGDMGQLGLGKQSDVEIIPHLVQGRLMGLRILQIACTLTATLVLTSDGSVFAWGHNKGGILGLALDIETVPCPQQVQIKEAVRCIAAANMGCVMAAASDKCIYKWGVEDEMNFAWNVNLPNIVQVNNILNVFAKYPIPRCGRLLDFQEFDKNLQRENSLSSDIDYGRPRDIGAALFNNEEYSDLTLRLSDGVIYVHKLILRTFCEHFKPMLDGGWSENDKKEIDLTSYNPAAYRAFVKYIYTGKLDQSLDGLQLIALCDIAESYLEHDLKRMVISKFSSCLTVDNSAELYSAAYLQSCQKLKEICCNFVSLHLEEVILSEGFENLKGDICKTLIKRAVQIKRGL